MKEKTIENSHKMFSHLVTECYCGFSDGCDLSQPNIKCENCISEASFLHKHGEVRFLYGAPEWHVETFIESYGITWSFADIVDVFPEIWTWIKKENENIMKTKLDAMSELREEIVFWYKLIFEIIPCIQEFSWIGTPKKQILMPNNNFKMTHDEIIKKTSVLANEKSAKSEYLFFQKHIITEANSAWKNKNFESFITKLSPYGKFLSKVEMAKLNYAKKKTGINRHERSR